MNDISNVGFVDQVISYWFIFAFLILFSIVYFVDID